MTPHPSLGPEDACNHSATGVRLARSWKTKRFVSSKPFFVLQSISAELGTCSLYPQITLDLVEVFFQICHTRLPLLNPTQFRAALKYSLSGQSAQPSSPHHLSPPSEKPIHPALLATVIAWGAKFSEHPLLVLDRSGGPNGSSRLAKTLVNRAREVAEAEKVHRISSVDHVVIALLIEPLQNRKFQLPSVSKTCIFLNTRLN